MRLARPPKGHVPWHEQLCVTLYHGRLRARIVVTNAKGNRMFDGTLWLFEQCRSRGYFVEARS